MKLTNKKEYYFSEEEYIEHIEKISEKAFNAGSDMKDCECEFDFYKRGYNAFTSFKEWFKLTYGI